MFHFISPKLVSHINRIEAKKHISLLVNAQSDACMDTIEYTKFRHNTQLKWKTAKAVDIYSINLYSTQVLTGQMRAANFDLNCALTDIGWPSGHTF